MKEFIPDYSKCTNEKKEIFHLMCTKLKKDVYMYCMLKKDYKCPAWEGYKHEYKYREFEG